MTRLESILSNKGWSQTEIAHASKVYAKPVPPVHLLWLPAALLAQTLVILRLLPILLITEHASIMIATVILSFFLSWAILEASPTLALGALGFSFALITIGGAIWFATLLHLKGVAPDLVFGRSLVWAAAWLAPLLITRLRRRI